MGTVNHPVMIDPHSLVVAPWSGTRRRGGVLARLVTDLRIRPGWMAAGEPSARPRKHEPAEFGSSNADAFAQNALVSATLFWPVPPS